MARGVHAAALEIISLAADADLRTPHHERVAGWWGGVLARRKAEIPVAAAHLAAAFQCGEIGLVVAQSYRSWWPAAKELLRKQEFEDCGLEA